MKTWFITGCSTGFGAAIAEAALARGDRVMLTARQTDRLAPLADRYPQTALRAAVDVTDPASVAPAIAATEDAFGGIDVFVNNAGYGVIGAVEEVSPDEYRRMFETNVFGLIEATRLALSALRESKGVLVNLSSNAGIWTRSGFGLYGATKAGVELISEALAQEVAPLGIRVLIVEPGAFRTDFLGRSMTRAAKRLAIYDETAGQMRDFQRDRLGPPAGRSGEGRCDHPAGGRRRERSAAVAARPGCPPQHSLQARRGGGGHGVLGRSDHDHQLPGRCKRQIRAIFNGTRPKPRSFAARPFHLPGRLIAEPRSV